MKVAASILAFLFGSSAFAGGMISSGGDLTKDSHNPWWLKNVSEVSYCVAIDTSAVSADPNVVSLLVAKAIVYWKSELGRSPKIVNDAAAINAYYNEIGVGRQNFKKINCNGSEDLKFQFGYGTLNKEQKDFIGDLRKVVGIAVRTDYDDVNLRGRGFIYIASDLGENRYESSNDIVATPWKTNSLLFFAIMHELGHVFGLPHVGPTYTLMSEQYMDFVLNKETAKVVEKFDPLTTTISPFFFSAPNLMVHCEARPLNSYFLHYVGAPLNSKCLYVVTDEDKKLMYLSVATEYGQTPMYIGFIHSLDLSAETGLAVTVVTTEKQKVFPIVTNPLSLIAGPSFFAISGSGIYTSAYGLSQPLYLNLRADRMELLGIIAGRIQSLVKGAASYWPSTLQ